MHVITLPELQRVVDSTPGCEELSSLLQQIVDSTYTATRLVVRVDLQALLKKPD